MEQEASTSTPVTTRSALREITRTASGSRTSFSNVLLFMETSPTSPDEEVVQKRGKRNIPAAFALTPPKTPTKKSPKKQPGTPSKGLTPRKGAFSSPLRSSPRKRLLLPSDISDAISASPSKRLVSPVKRLRLQARDHEVDPAVALKALTKTQLVSLLQDIMQRSPSAKQAVQDLLPEPDLVQAEQKLEKLLRNIYRSFPSKHWGNSRDAFCFRRVQAPLDSFKRKCLERGQQLCSAEQWSALLEYVQLAWSFVRKLPDWDDAAHNRTKLLCFRGLAVLCMTALKKALLEPCHLGALIARLREMQEDSTSIASCIKFVEARLEKLQQ